MRLRTATSTTAAGSAGTGTAVHGALAVDRDVAPAPERSRPLPEPEPARPNPLARITTLQPRSYNEARTIGERYRDGIPVIMNLTELDDAAAKRLVDFAAGLAFALRGSIDKVTSRVFLLTPPEVEVSADDARMLAERSRLFGDG
jgi:cell division inhibitor SepF